MGSLVRRIALVTVWAVVACWLLPVVPARAAGAYLVNLAGDAGNGSGNTGDIRYAINQASANPGSTITFDTIGTGAAIMLTHGTLTVSASMTITGPGANLLAVDGNHATTVFTVGNGATVSISGLTIRNGKGSDGTPGTNGINGVSGVNNGSGGSGSIGGADSAGGIVNGGTLTLMNVTVSGNTGGQGGHGGHGWRGAAGHRCHPYGGTGGTGGTGGRVASGERVGSRTRGH